jgi:predicted Zn-dependent protease
MPAKVWAGPSIIRDTEIESTLQEWTKNVFAAAGMDSSQIDIILVQSSDVNAFVAGGSNIFIYTGLIDLTKTPEELIGVIAHETGHIAGGHLIRTRRAIQNASFESLLAMALGVGAALAGAGGEAASAGIAIGNATATNSFLAHSRVQESAADQAAASYLSKAGVDSQGLISFLEKISSQELLTTSQQSSYMRTHPLSRDRIEALQYKLSSQKVSQNKNTKWVDQHARMKAKLQAFISPQQIIYTYPSPDTSITANYARAIAAYRLNKTTEALQGIDNLIKAEPRNPYFHELKGQMLYDFGKTKESLAPYKTALTLIPNAGLIRTAYAQSLIDTGAYQQVLSELGRAERDEPRSPRVKRLLATATGRLGRENEAKVYLAEEALMQNRKGEATTLAKTAFNTLPNNSPLRIRAQDVLSLTESLESEEK